MDFETAYNQHQKNRRLIIATFGEQTIQRSSADWGGIDNWSINGNEYEGVFIVDMKTCNAEFSFILIKRSFNEDTEENEDEYLFTTNLDEELESNGTVEELIVMAQGFKNRGL